MPLPPPEIITKDQYDQIALSGKIGPMKHGYPAVIIHDDNTITKLWAKKSGIFSSSRWRPYSARFVQNAQKLHEAGVIVPQIIAHQRIANSHVHLVQYHSLEGTSIRELLEHNPEQIDIPSLARYYYDLHEKGIIFRAIHFGNVIQMPDQQYGLIDFTDVSFLNKPAPLIRRAANIATPLRYRQDIKRLKEAKLPGFPESYLSILKKKHKTVDENIFNQTIEDRTRNKS